MTYNVLSGTLSLYATTTTLSRQSVAMSLITKQITQRKYIKHQITNLILVKAQKRYKPRAVLCPQYFGYRCKMEHSVAFRRGQNAYLVGALPQTPLFKTLPQTS